MFLSVYFIKDTIGYESSNPYSCGRSTCYSYSYTSDYDNTSECVSSSVVIVDPPSVFNLNSPADGKIFYYDIKKTAIHTPTFGWAQPENWGWDCETNDNSKTYTFYLINEDNGEKSSINNMKTPSYQFSSDIPDGKYKWFVSADLVTTNTSSDTWSFEICTIDIGDFNLVYPKSEEIISSNSITFKWEEPILNTECADKSKYQYEITVYSGSEKVFNDKTEWGTNEIVVNLETQTTYTWKVVAHGPGEISVTSKTNNFTYCVSEPPSISEISLPMPKAYSCEASNGNSSYEFSWSLTSKGKNCNQAEGTTIDYIVQLCSESNCKNETYNEVAYTRNFTCSTMSYNITVWAWNGYAYSDSREYEFSICEKTAPSVPVLNDVPKSYCDVVTKITWSLSDWGSYCINLDKNNTFNLYYKKGSFSNYVPIECQRTGTFEYNLELDEGTWEVWVEAVSRNGLSTTSEHKSIEASFVPKPENLDWKSEDDVELSWSITDEFMECEDIDSYKYLVEYKTNEASSSQTLDIGNKTCTIQGMTGQIEWSVSVIRNGVVLSTQDDTFNTDDRCVEKKPYWMDPDNVLKSPEDNKVLFESVTFTWEASKPGVACTARKDNTKSRDVEGEGTESNLVVDKSAEKGYRIVINDLAINTTATTYVKTMENTGNYSWYVVSYVGNVESEKMKNRSFCIADLPPVPRALDYNPFKPNEVSWTSDPCKNKMTNYYIYNIITS